MTCLIAHHFLGPWACKMFLSRLSPLRMTKHYNFTLLLLLKETSRVDELRCNPFSARIVYLFSEDGSGELNFQRFINMMSVFSGRTSRQTKAVWAFALWDFDGTCVIRHSRAHCKSYAKTDLYVRSIHRVSTRHMHYVLCKQARAARNV